MMLETKLLAILFFGGTSAIAATAVAMVPQDLTVVERYGVLGLLSIVVLGVGGAGIKILIDLNKSIAENTTAVKQLAVSIGTLVTQNQEAHRTYAGERDKAVATVVNEVRELENRLIREFERNNGGNDRGGKKGS